MNKRNPSWKAAIACLALLCHVASAADAGRMHAAMAAHVESGFRGSVLVEKNGEILLDAGYGEANVEWSVPNSPQTKFRIASLTKQFTAAAILMLEERGLLRIEDSMARYFEGLPESWDGITLYHLLTHTSGIPDLSGDEEDWERFVPTSFAALLDEYRNVPLDSAPGERYRYSNFGYSALGAIIEKVSGQSYAQFLQQNVFDKLGMGDTGYDENARIIPQRASGYTWNGETLRNADYFDMTRPMAAGGLYSTVDDLRKWNAALHSGQVVSKASAARMMTAFKGDYGFGLIVHDVLGQSKVWHNGAISGFSSVLAHYPESGATVIVLANVEGKEAESVARELEFIVLDLDVVLPSEWKPMELTEADLARFVGTYEFREGLEMKFWIEDGRLFSQATGNDALALTPSDGMRFYPDFPYARFEFKTSADGAVDRVEYYQGGQKYALNRL